MTTSAEWCEVVDVNLTGVYHTVRAAIGSLIRCGHGSLVTIASEAAIYGNPGQDNYAAAKAGVIAVTKSVARENGCLGVRANVAVSRFPDECGKSPAQVSHRPGPRMSGAQLPQTC